MTTARPHSADLNSARRSREWSELPATEPVDLLVVGGGVTGAGIALDAASRGLSVVLAEKHDLAFGTSRWSSKLVHGGLRYLASGSVGIAHESAVERGVLIEHTAPHLVRALPQVMPLLPGVSRPNAALVRAGFLAGDALRIAARTSAASLPRSRRLRAERVLEYAPGVARSGLRGGLAFWDGQLSDDVRLVVALARTAAAYGARVLTRCAATDVTGGGAVLRDELTGETAQLNARTVINAAGVWAGQVAPDIGLRPSRGAHLVFSQEVFGPLTAGLTVPVPGETNRFVFALPAPERRVYVGLTDEEAPGEIPDVPHATDDEIDFLLATLNTALHQPLAREDLLGTFAGLRPLLDSGSGRTADVSRKHAVITGRDGLVSVVGGKLTTYRRMAEDALDAALARAEQAGRPLAAGPCRTRRLPLVGAADRPTLARVAAPPRLVGRYGVEAVDVLAEAEGEPELLRPVADGVETIGAELRYAVRREGALDVSDLLDRRTRVGLGATARTRAERIARELLRR
ncbi:glycerol-3-phosphate dehydrogenase/oxidase [Streptomyces sp. P38-E01]|uniref:Glycerol-3-phosphate dehydrogenase/oxidase n=1 Tax=Streptomyces tardus TaxID=2780544 RepID=A0A949N1Q5_9ACTN|nr:glycerol-3-phosphate dehydrogenase/oxidase [Streptomyces tardus]MBU7598100.1 glycerol-3-phosphate dehydrogenase/oxidase [Streptomyces tardus]